MSASWLLDRRAQALAAAESLPVPTLRDEHWRYTSLRGIDFASYQAPTAAPAETVPAGLLLGGGVEAGRLVQRDGAVVHVELDPAVAAQGVLLLPLEQAAAEHPQLVEEHLGALVGTTEKFAAENAALWSGGAFVYVPKGVHVERPLHVAFDLATEGSALQWRLLVVVGESASATLVEEHPRGVPGYANGVAEVHVGANARLEYVTIQNRHDDALHFAFHRASVARDAELDWAACWLGARTGKTWMQTELTGPGSRGKLTGFYVADGTRHVDLDTTQEHRAPHAVSDLYFKGVLDDRARSVWRGIITVSEGAQGTDAYQQDRNLMLSPTAHADSIPGLEIKANEVRCTHGATAGPVDPGLLYYLMSRGLVREEAQQLIVDGFFQDVLERIESEPVREAIAGALLARIR